MGLLSLLPDARAFETLDRGMIALPTASHSVYIGWRILERDPAGLVYNLYRLTEGEERVKLNDGPIVEGSNFVDTNAQLDRNTTYWIKSVRLPRGSRPREGEELARVELSANTPAKHEGLYPRDSKQGENGSAEEPYH